MSVPSAAMVLKSGKKNSMQTGNGVPGLFKRNQSIFYIYSCLVIAALLAARSCLLRVFLCALSGELWQGKIFSSMEFLPGKNCKAVNNLFVFSQSEMAERMH
jgi:hypothetical protein